MALGYENCDAVRPAVEGDSAIDLPRARNIPRVLFRRAVIAQKRVGNRMDAGGAIITSFRIKIESDLLRGFA